jgi:hypothetical protein
MTVSTGLESLLSKFHVKVLYNHLNPTSPPRSRSPHEISTFVRAHASYLDQLLIPVFRTADPPPARNCPVRPRIARSHVLRRGRHHPPSAVRCGARPALEQAIPTEILHQPVRTARAHAALLVLQGRSCRPGPLARRREGVQAGHRAHQTKWVATLMCGLEANLKGKSDSESVCGHDCVSLGRAGRAGDERAQRGQAETGDRRAVPVVQVRARAARASPKTDQSPSTNGACAKSVKVRTCDSAFYPGYLITG